MKMKQWIADRLFALLTWLSPTEQPTPGELRAWAREEVQKPPQPQIWYDPTVRSYPPPQKIVNPRGRYFKAHHLEFMPAQPIDPFPDWLNSAISVEHMTPAEIERVPTIRDLDPLNTDEYPAVVKLLHQDREQRRHAG